MDQLIKNDSRYNIKVIFICQLLFQKQPHCMLYMHQVVDIGNAQVDYDDHTTEEKKYHFSEKKTAQLKDQNIFTACTMDWFVQTLTIPVYYKILLVKFKHNL